MINFFPYGGWPLPHVPGHGWGFMCWYFRPTIYVHSSKRNYGKENNAIFKDLFLGTYDVRTLSKDHHLESLLHEIKHIKWHIIGLSEVRKIGNSLIEVDDNLLYYHGHESKKQSGVGFLINSSIKNHVKKFASKSDRAASLTLQLTKRNKLTIFQVYSPTSTSYTEDIEGFYGDIRSLIKDERSDFNIIMGDINSKVGKAETNEPSIGNFTFGERNELGVVLSVYGQHRGRLFASARDLLYRFVCVVVHHPQAALFVPWFAKDFNVAMVKESTYLTRCKAVAQLEGSKTQSEVARGIGVSIRTVKR